MGHAQTKYLSPQIADVYQEMYDYIEELNGDYDPFPSEIETFHGQTLKLRNDYGYLVKKHRVINVGKDESNYSVSDNYSNYSYINFIAAKCWIDTAISRSPASLNHQSKGFKALSGIVLSDKAFSSERVFAKEISSQLSAIMLANKSDQRVWLAIRQFANYAIENSYWGFDETVIFKLDEVVIPNSGTKQRVSLLDNENGPFTRSEIAQISTAIQDGRLSLKHKVMVRLAMKFGLRPIQMALLREEDVYYDSKVFAWFINIPRVKGKVAQLRRNENNFLLRQLPQELADDIQALIASESDRSLRDLDGIRRPRPLFKRSSANEHYLNAKKLVDYAWHTSSSRITKDFTGTIQAQLGLKSAYVKDEDGNPLPLKITAYRFRYTLGTRMVLEGKTPEDVAVALDHSSIASVDHYFRYNRDLMDFIDDTFESSKVLSNSIARWEGYIIDDDDNTVKGSVVRGKDLVNLGKCLKQSRCEWHPSVSCYGCGQFRPFKNADHKSQLKVIEDERDFVRNNSSGPVQHQLDEAYEGAIQIVEAQKIIIREVS
ncbi:site-specific integrase [Alteromonas sp. NFXS44]|uniref:site-specific integrase n=1 Tax=Alteromonas sp. NFXS44 TaxID=2818435 RepID=UPI0032DF8BC0